MGLAVFAAMCCLAWGLPAAAQASSSPPEAQTEAAEAIPGGAKLKGKLNPGGLPTTYYFEYARDTCDEGCTPRKTAKAGPLTGDTMQEVPAVEVTGLSGSGGSERYWYILVATNADGTVYGGLVNFTPGAPLPAIESTVAYQIMQTDATLEAKINPESLPGERGAYYQFQVVTNTSEYSPEIVCPVKEIWPLGLDGCIGTHAEALPIGFIERGTGGSYVRVDLAKAGMTLTSGTTYHYRVLAARAKQTEDTLEWEAPPVYGPDQTFTTLTPGTPPAIEGETASNITSNDATLEAKIDPEGLATTYEFYLEAPSCQNDKRVEACEASGGVPIAKGSVPAGSAAQAVSVDVAGTGHSLSPDTIEGYRVVASNSAGTSYGGEKTFTTLPGPPPVIESVSLSHLTSTDATLEAKIDTEGLPTLYEFYMWSSCAHEQCEDMMKIPLPSGLLLGSFVGQSVSLDLNSAGVTLRYGEEYGWRVTATNGAGHTSANSRFEPPPSVVEPMGATTSTSSGAGQPAGSNGGDQPAGSGGSSSSSTPSFSPTPSVGVLGAPTGKASEPKPLKNAQKLAKALKACAKKPKGKQAVCEKLARRKYHTVAKKSKR